MAEKSQDRRKPLTRARPVAVFSTLPAPTIANTEPPQAPITPLNLHRITRLAWFGLLAAVAVIGVIAMPAKIWAGDPTAWREETRSLLHRRTLSIDPLIPATKFNDANQPGQYFVQNSRNKLWYSKYGIINSLMSLPPVLLQQLMRHDTAAPFAESDPLILNLWNVALSVALAAALMSLSGSYTTRLGTRIVFVASTMYCTYLCFYLRAQSSEIYQTLFYAMAFLFLARWVRKIKNGSDSSWRFASAMWLMVAVLALTRVFYVILIPLFGLIGAIAIHRTGSWRRWPQIVLPPLLIAAVCGLINFVKFGSPFLSGYHQWMPEMHLPTGPMLTGLHGLLLQPRFSLPLYFPTIVLGLPMSWRFARQYPLESAAAFGSLALFLLSLSKIPTWAGEWTYGPRYILFALPVASLPLILLIDWLADRAPTLRYSGAGVLAAILLYSGWLQFRANQVDFFAWYYLRPSEFGVSNPPWFESRPVGIVLDELQRHRDNLESLPWFAQFKDTYAPRIVEQYRQRVHFVLSDTNFYWWREIPKATASPPNPERPR